MEDLLEQILQELKSINEKLDKMTDNGYYGFSDVCSSVSSVESEVGSVVTAIKRLSR